MNDRLRAGPLGSLLILLAASACGLESPADVRDVDTATVDLDVLGGVRSYRLYVPPGASGDRPLLFVFHGAAQGAAGIELMSWLYPVADDEGLILLFPEAAGDYWNTPNSPAGYWNVADLPFVEAMIDDVDRRVGIDRSRVYAAGYSNGAIFAQVVGCLLGNQVAGIGVVGAGVSAEVSESCPWTRPLPVTVFFGDRDPSFFWDDGLASGVGMLGGGGSATWLARTNRCDPDPIVTESPGSDGDETSVQLWEYEGCAEGSAVAFYRIAGGGHTWPGSPLNLPANFGRKTRAIDASRAMVDFFLQFRTPGR